MRDASKKALQIMIAWNLNQIDVALHLQRGCGWMDFYWLYDIPNWALFIVVIGTLLVISLTGAMVLRQKFDRLLGLSEETNDLVGHFLSFTGAFYGIMLGLVAVGAWETFNAANDSVDREASAMAALYHDVMQLPAPTDGRGQVLLREYATRVIADEWPQQRQGISPQAGERPLRALGVEIGMTPTSTPNASLLLGEALGQYNKLLEARRARLQTIGEGLPPSLWAVIILGALINVSMTWLLSIKNPRLDLTVNILMALTLGSVLAFIIAMDNPYRGELSVTADSIEDVYVNVMQGDVISGKLN
jgi:Protein of unknown function (DUF4239)